MNYTNRTLITIVVAVTTISITHSSAHAVTSCTQATLLGGFGELSLSAPSQTGAYEGLINFDGVSNISGSETDVDGSIVTKYSITGTYSVSATCTVTIRANYHLAGAVFSNQIYSGVIVNNGTKIDSILTGSSRTVTPQVFVLESIQ